MKNSKIEWTDHTFNPWIGCSKVSPGCANCYAERDMDHRRGRVKWGKGQPRSRTSAAYWKQPLRWNRDFPINYAAAKYSGIALHRPRVFCASLADWLDEEVPAEWLFDLISLIHKTPNLNWLLLTKRPENFASRLRAAAAQCILDPLDITDRIHAWLDGTRIYRNVWIGVSVEDQPRADERIPELLKIPARVRFLSCEPLLGPVDIDLWLSAKFGKLDANFREIETPEKKIHWVIAGGESGPGARPMNPQWARSLRDQCAAAGVAFHFKQFGEWAPNDVNGPLKGERQLVQLNGHHFDRYFLEPAPSGAEWMERIGKKAAGRLLDGVTHDGFPNL